MKHFIQIIIFLLPYFSFCQNETGIIDGSAYNIIYSHTTPKVLKVIDGIAYKQIKKKIVSASDSVNSRFIFLGEKNPNSIELAGKLTDLLRNYSDFDSISKIYRYNKDQDISEDYTGWFRKGEKWADYEQFCFAQDSQKIGWTIIEFGVIIIEIIDKSDSKTIFEVPIYNFSKGFTGKIKDFSDTKSITSISKWKRGLRDGRNLEYWSNGKSKIDAIYKSGEKWGYYREWFENGQIKSEDIYVKGNWIESKLWSFTGELISTTNKNNSFPIKFK